MNKNDYVVGGEIVVGCEQQRAEGFNGLFEEVSYGDAMQPVSGCWTRTKRMQTDQEIQYTWVPSWLTVVDSDGQRWWCSNRYQRLPRAQKIAVKSTTRDCFKTRDR